MRGIQWRRHPVPVLIWQLQPLQFDSPLIFPHRVPRHDSKRSRTKRFARRAEPGRKQPGFPRDLEPRHFLFIEHLAAVNLWQHAAIYCLFILYFCMRVMWGWRSACCEHEEFPLCDFCIYSIPFFFSFGVVFCHVFMFFVY